MPARSSQKRPASETWVLNASPVIALARIGRIDIIEQAEIVIPDLVATEIAAGPRGEPARRLLERGWRPVVPAGALSEEILEWGLGAGERGVLAVATRMAGSTAILDDATIRRALRDGASEEWPPPDRRS